MKTSELTGAALDWAVAKCEGLEPFTDGISWIIDIAGAYRKLPKYSADWARGGPIIERENIGLVCQHSESTGRCAYRTTKDDERFYHYGDTVLIAAMRCYVAFKLGDEVEIPDALE